ncbi:MAG: hypothetical protein EPO40_05720 [Myxococcaceae bacterium]|nr:MAG: hypothetical protein EPO40_05720 [Myxococcaceae bacterium]
MTDKHSLTPTAESVAFWRRHNAFFDATVDAFLASGPSHANEAYNLDDFDDEMPDGKEGHREAK